MKETGYKLEKVTVLLRETWTPEGHKEGWKSFSFKLHDNFISSEGLAPSTEKNQFSAKFPDLGDVYVISESCGHVPVSLHTESTG